MKYSLLTNIQVAIMSTLVGIVSAILISINIWYLETKLLPEVYIDAAGQCIKVVNYENGHTFNCDDVDILLRRYHKVIQQ